MAGRFGLKGSMMQYNDFRWSPMLGCDAARISMVDAQNQEHFAIIAADVPGSVYRERRRKALEAIEAPIRNGRDPGEVAVSTDAG